MKQQELPEDKPRMLNGAWSVKNILTAVENGVDIFDSSYASVLAENNKALKTDFSDACSTEIIDLSERK